MFLELADTFQIWCFNRRIL